MSTFLQNEWRLPSAKSLSFISLITTAMHLETVTQPAYNIFYGLAVSISKGDECWKNPTNGVDTEC